MKKNFFLSRSNRADAYCFSANSATCHSWIGPLGHSETVVEITIRIPVKREETCLLKFGKRLPANSVVYYPFIPDENAGYYLCKIETYLHQGQRQTLQNIIQSIKNNIIIGKYNVLSRFDDDDLPF